MFYQEVNSNHSGYHDIRISHNFVYGSHCHDDFELVYSLAGTTELTVNGQSFLVRSGEWAMVLNNQIHSYESVSQFSSVLIHVFSGDICGSFFRTAAGKTAKNPVFQVPVSVRDFYLDTVCCRRDYSSFTLKGVLYLLLKYYLDQVELMPGKSMQGSLISSIFSYISTHFTERITLEDVAKVCGYDAHYLSRIFSSVIGINFKRIVNSYRINYAISLMGEGKLSMTEIAFASGFGSIRSFNRAFAEHCQCTPQKYPYYNRDAADRDYWITLFSSGEPKGSGNSGYVKAQMLWDGYMPPIPAEGESSASYGNGSEPQTDH